MNIFTEVETPIGRPHLPSHTPMAPAMSTQPLQFGVLPSNAVANLTPDTDWRERSTAIDVVHATILRTTDASLFLPHLGPLITFLTSLILTDPNFKVVLITLRALDDLVTTPSCVSPAENSKMCR